MLARLPAAGLACLCLTLLAAIAWMARSNPVPAAIGAAAWSLVALRRPVLQGLAAVAARWPATRPDSRAIEAVNIPGVMVVQADLAMDGRLSGAVSVEVFGRLCGVVESRTLHVHPDGQFEGLVMHRWLRVDPGAWFEGSALPFPQDAEAQARTPGITASAHVVGIGFEVDQPSERVIDA